MTDRVEPRWLSTPPSRFDIVTCLYPEDTDYTPGRKLRPTLVVQVLRDTRESGSFACEVAFGTSSLKILQRQHLDVIIQNASHLTECGLPRATRFDLDNKARLPWNQSFFGCWPGYRTPIIGSLTESYFKDYAFLMMKRGAFWRSKREFESIPRRVSRRLAIQPARPTIPAQTTTSWKLFVRRMSPSKAPALPAAPLGLMPCRRVRR